MSYRKNIEIISGKAHLQYAKFTKNEVNGILYLLKSKKIEQIVLEPSSVDNPLTEAQTKELMNIVNQVKSLNHIKIFQANDKSLQVLLDNISISSDSQIKHVSIHSANVSSYGMQKIAQLIKNNPKDLHSFKIEGEYDVGGINHINNSLKYNDNLKELFIFANSLLPRSIKHSGDFYDYHSNYFQQITPLIKTISESKNIHKLGIGPMNIKVANSLLDNLIDGKNNELFELCIDYAVPFIKTANESQENLLTEMMNVFNRQEPNSYNLLRVFSKDNCGMSHSLSSNQTNKYNKLQNDIHNYCSLGFDSLKQSRQDNILENKEAIKYLLSPQENRENLYNCSLDDLNAIDSLGVVYHPEL